MLAPSCSCLRGRCVAPAVCRCSSLQFHLHNCSLLYDSDEIILGRQLLLSLAVWRAHPSVCELDVLSLVVRIGQLSLSGLGEARFQQIRLRQTGGS